MKEVISWNLPSLVLTQMSRFVDQEAVYVRGSLVGEGSSDVENYTGWESYWSSEGEYSEDVSVGKGSSAMRQRSKRKLSLSEESDPEPASQHRSNVRNIKQRRNVESSKTRKSGYQISEKRRSSNDQELKEIQRSNKLLMTLVERTGKTEKHLQVVEDKLTNESVK